VLGVNNGRGGTIEIRSNGRAVRTVAVPSDPKATDPLLVDLSAVLAVGGNEISLVPRGSAAIGTALLRLTSSHWIPWHQTKTRNSPELRFEVSFDRMDIPAGEPVRCTVTARRVGFRGYGMLLAEIGLPPGAEVDRSSLQALRMDRSLSLDHYEVLPDRVVFYLWPEAGGSTFDFFLTARYPMKAKSGASTLYDYYNPEALAEVPPTSWTVR
jgi:hypothetical protein